MKLCLKCKIEKELDCFYKHKTKLFQPYCKSCFRQIKKDWYELKKDDLRIKARNNSQIYRINNLEKVKSNSLKYYYNNKEKMIEYAKNYNKNNQEKIKENKKLLYQYKIKTDPIFKLKESTRKMILKSIKKKNLKKNNRTIEILGCSFDNFKLYLESKFESWMTWDNYGKYNGELNYGWDIDHIIPLSSAKIEDDIIRLNYYTNLQPLCSKINRDIKKDNYEKSTY